MKTKYIDLRAAVKCAVRLMNQFGREEAFITEIESGEEAGKYIVTPDKLSDKSIKAVR